MLQISFLFIRSFIALLIAATLFKKHFYKILVVAGVITFAVTILLVGLRVINPITADGIVDFNQLFIIIVGLSTGGAIFYFSQKYKEKLKALGISNAEPDMDAPADSVAEVQESQAVVCDTPPLEDNIKLHIRLDTELARKVFAKAIENGYMTIDGKHYKWHKNKVLLAYMCGRIYCEDYTKFTQFDQKPFWKAGHSDLFPDVELNALFRTKQLVQSRHTRTEKAAPVGFEKIDKLFE